MKRYWIIFWISSSQLLAGCSNKISSLAERPIEEIIEIQYPRKIAFSGQVLFPNGEPAPFSTVRTEEICDTCRIHMVDKARTDENGNFSFQTRVGEDSRAIRISVEQMEGYWIRTGKTCFAGELLGDSPEFNLENSENFEGLILFLGTQGGEIEFIVFDSYQNKNIRGSMSIEKIDGVNNCSIGIATGDDGSGHPRIFPPGRYKVELDQFDCNGVSYSIENPIESRVTVKPSEISTHIIEFDSSKIDVKKIWFSNPTGERCKLEAN